MSVERQGYDRTPHRNNAHAAENQHPERGRDCAAVVEPMQVHGLDGRKRTCCICCVICPMGIALEAGRQYLKHPHKHILEHLPIFATSCGRLVLNSLTCRQFQ